jgi:hypothetical protein
MKPNTWAPLGLLTLFVLLAVAFRPTAERPVAASTLLLLLPDTLRKDPDTGLAVDGNLMLVKAQCTSCHSPKLITQNRFTRSGWQQKIRWMQANHNLWDLGDTEKVVLDYLEKYYGPAQAVSNGHRSRRAPLRDISWYPLTLEK